MSNEVGPKKPKTSTFQQPGSLVGLTMRGGDTVERVSVAQLSNTGPATGVVPQPCTDKPSEASDTSSHLGHIILTERESVVSGVNLNVAKNAKNAKNDEHYEVCAKNEKYDNEECGMKRGILVESQQANTCISSFTHTKGGTTKFQEGEHAQS